jgi:hypothetical protein
MHALWKTTEEAVLRERWKAGDSLQKIAILLPGRTVGALKSYRDKHRMKRDVRIGTQRPSVVWEAIKDALKGEQIEDALDAGRQLSVAELVDETGFSKAACIKHVHAKHGKGLRVGAWRRTSRKPAALWALGDEPDAPYPVTPVARRIGKRKERQLRLAVNPFAAAAGLVEVPTGTPGRVFQQPMEGGRIEEEMAA